MRRTARTFAALASVVCVYAPGAIAQVEELERQEKEKAFFAKHGVEMWSSAPELAANPYVFIGKKVAIRVAFVRMSSKSTAMFWNGMGLGMRPMEDDLAHISLHNVDPADFYKKKGQLVVAVDVSEGEDGKPNFLLLGMHRCQVERCYDMYPQK